MMYSYFKLTKTLFWPVVVAVLLLTSACETEVDVYSEYETVPVVFGVLDRNLNAVTNTGWHWIRINKTFQSKEDPFVGAASQDSSSFDKVEATITAFQLINGKATEVKKYTLIDSLIPGKQAGIFNSGAQRMYGFFEPNLPTGGYFQLDATCYSGSEVFNIKAQTEVVEGVSQQIFASVNFSPVVAGSFVAGNNVKESIVYEINPAKNTKSGDLILNFYYRDFYQDPTTGNTYDTARVLTYTIGSFVVADPENPQVAQLFFSGTRFFERISVLLKNRDEVPNLIYRKIDDRFGLGEIEFISGAAVEDLHTFIEVNNPVNEGFQARPVFSNIEGGIGIFSSRAVFSLPYFINNNPTQVLSLSNLTKRELATGLISGFTGDKGFCFDEVAVNAPCP